MKTAGVPMSAIVRMENGVLLLTVPITQRMAPVLLCTPWQLAADLGLVRDSRP